MTFTTKSTGAPHELHNGDVLIHDSTRTCPEVEAFSRVEEESERAARDAYRELRESLGSRGPRSADTGVVEKHPGRSAGVGSSTAGDVADARVQASALRDVAALTAGEQRVVGLAIEGLTNCEIAQKLFLTRQSVGYHLGNAYRKLGVRSRDELSKALRGSAERPPPRDPKGFGR